MKISSRRSRSIEVTYRKSERQMKQWEKRDVELTGLGAVD
jgi:hypothetical protein